MDEEKPVESPVSTTDGEDEARAARKRKGFGSNPENINRGGRPKGSRNKSKLIVAQLGIDDLAVVAVERLGMLMMGDSAGLGIKDEIPPKLQFDAMKELLGKAIAGEKDKLGVESKKASGKTKDETAATPKVFTTAKKA